MVANCLPHLLKPRRDFQSKKEQMILSITCSAVGGYYNAWKIESDNLNPNKYAEYF